METSDCRRIVERHASDMMYGLGLGNWKINIVYAQLDEDCVGLCHTNEEYKQAQISIDPVKCDSSDDVAAVLFHEMLHVVLARLHHAHDVAKESRMSQDEWDMLNFTMRNAGEAAITQLEYSFHIIGISPKQFAQRARRMKRAKASQVRN